MLGLCMTSISDTHRATVRSNPTARTIEEGIIPILELDLPVSEFF